MTSMMRDNTQQGICHAFFDNLGNFGAFQVFWGILGHFGAFWGNLGHFGAFWAIASRWGPRGGAPPTPQYLPPIPEALRVPDKHVYARARAYSKWDAYLDEYIMYY